MRFLHEYLLVQDIWWIRIRSMATGVVMWSYMIRLMDVLRFLKQNTRKIRKNWKVHVIPRCNR